MKTATVKELKNELINRTEKELIDICLRLSKFKKENKELLTYLLYDSYDEEKYIRDVKEEVDENFKEINRKSKYYINKSSRKILRSIKKHIRYSKRKETEVELLLYFCYKLKNMTPSMETNTVLKKIFKRQIEIIVKIISTFHEDLQFDYEIELDELT